MAIPDSTIIDLEKAKQVLNDRKNLNHEELINLEKKWRLAYHLQFSLDIESIIHFFTSALENYVAYDSLTYQHPDYNLTISQGAEQNHHIHYQLTLDNIDLGQLMLTRRTKFNTTEITDFEDLLCVLVYPIKNALQYLDAIKLSLYDPLTGVANRIGLLPTLHSELELSKRHHGEISVLMIDIDNFKSVNDQYGHGCGDYILTAIAQQISDLVRDCDLLYRYGGDEFVLLLRNTNKIGAITLADRIRHTINSTKYRYKKIAINLTVSIGVATAYPEDSKNTLLDRADEALYRSKNSGKNLVSM